jgi:hypothetical protein
MPQSISVGTAVAVFDMFLVVLVVTGGQHLYAVVPPKGSSMPPVMVLPAFDFVQVVMTWLTAFASATTTTVALEVPLTLPTNVIDTLDATAPGVQTSGEPSAAEGTGATGSRKRKRGVVQRFAFDDPEELPEVPCQPLTQRQQRQRRLVRGSFFQHRLWVCHEAAMPDESFE